LVLLSGFGLILGYRPNSVRNFDWLPFTPPLVASSVLQKCCFLVFVWIDLAHENYFLKNLGWGVWILIFKN
jgi:hypothetical protein